MADPYTAAGPVTIRDLTGQVLRTEPAHKARHKPAERATPAPKVTYWPTPAWETTACTQCGTLIHPGQLLYLTDNRTYCGGCAKT